MFLLRCHQCNLTFPTLQISNLIIFFIEIKKLKSEIIWKRDLKIQIPKKLQTFEFLQYNKLHHETESLDNIQYFLNIHSIVFQSLLKIQGYSYFLNVALPFRNKKYGIKTKNPNISKY